MQETSVVGILLLVANLVVTYNGLSNFTIQEKYNFHIDRILISKEYYRLITSGFLHVGWWHFGFNMIALLSFAPVLEIVFGWYGFILLYFISLVGGNVLALFVHRNHGDYRAVGASGAVSGVVFAIIILDPMSTGIRLMFLPLPIYAWIYGAAYLAYTIWGIKSQRDNIGHEAHLGGALIGMLGAIVVYPFIIVYSPWTTIALIVPVVGFLVLIVSRPEFLILPGTKGLGRGPKLKKQKPTMSKEEELNKLLDKIQKKGLNGLTAKEKQRLRELSK